MSGLAEDKAIEEIESRLNMIRATRVCLFEQFNTLPYDFKYGKPPMTEEDILKQSIEKYSKIVKVKRDREQDEWLRMHRAMLEKRRKVLREQQKYALNHYYNKLLNNSDANINVVVPRTLPSYNRYWRPRLRPTRHYERARTRRARLPNYNMPSEESYEDDYSRYEDARYDDSEYSDYESQLEKSDREERRDSDDNSMAEEGPREQRRTLRRRSSKGRRLTRQR